MSDPNESVEQSDPQVEKDAREMGWVPEGDFKGDKSKWVDAKTFVDRGHHVLPIVQAANRRQREELTNLNNRLSEQAQALAASQETIKALEEYHQSNVKQQVEAERKRLLDELAVAKKTDNVDDEVRITDQLTRFNAEHAVADAAPAPKKSDTPPAKDWSKDPVFLDWRKDNPWYGYDKVRSSLAHTVVMELRAGGDTTIGRAFLDRVTEQVNAEMSKLQGGNGSGNGSSKVEGGRPGGGRSNGGGKSYNDLPSDAKASCDSFTARLVGPGKLYKNADDWRAKYAQDYFRSSQ